jgi:hypothetical protein
MLTACRHLCYITVSGIHRKKWVKEICSSESTIFRGVTQCNPLNVNRRFGGTYRLHLQGKLCLSPDFTLVSCSAYSSTLKMEAICTSETSVDIQQTTGRYIPQGSTLHNHHCENLKSYIVYLCLRKEAGVLLYADCC